MALDFYIAESLNDVDYDGLWTFFGDDFMGYLYENRNQLPAEVRVFNDLDYYARTLFEGGGIPELSAACHALLRSRPIADYDQPDSDLGGKHFVASLAIQVLIRMCEVALRHNKSIVAIGD